jgi:GNAT superfamily N-acetyltransferase
MENTLWYQVDRVHNVDQVTLDGLVQVLIDCVQGGASVSFMLPLDEQRALGFWRDVSVGVHSGKRVLLVARDEQGVLGTVQLILDQPENQPHRADLAKLLVHRRGRRRGVAMALMQAAEEAAIDAGKSLLVLDTADAVAARIYSRLGWIRCGEVPGYALLPGGGLCATTFFYRQLRG